MTFRPAGAPTCFGDWSAAAVECAGGLDATYRDPGTGSHRREKCTLYAACAQNSSSKSATPHVQAPPKPAPSHPMVPQWPYATVQPRFQQAPPPQALHNPQLAPQQNYVPPWVAQQGPQVVPQPYPQPGGQVHPYLTVPEPVNPNEHWFKRLLREVVRSMFKSSGHTAASFFDHNPFQSYPIPQDQLPPAPPQNAPDKKGP